MNFTRKIIHIDMDAFYASVEQRDFPELRGKPIAVGGDSDRGVVSTASYEARLFGVHSAMSMVKAKSLCPELVVVHPRHEYYEEIGEQIRGIFRECSDLVEPLSIDEAFIDVTDNKLNMPLAVDVAKYIKSRIHENLSLTASAGVSYCKFLAKVASDYRKPDGLFVIHPDRALAFLAQLPIEDFWGVGKVTAKRMHELGIHNGANLRDCSLLMLTREFGKSGQIYYDFARGIDTREVRTDWVRKSVGCEHTLERDINLKSSVIIELYHVATELVERIHENDFRGITLTLKIKFHDFEQITRSFTKASPFVSLEDILPHAKSLLEGISYFDHPIRLIGLTVSNPKKEESAISSEWTQLSLPFDDY
ncbi:MAG: DNA polymerase IV [Bacteroidaceae bacterium]|nr:DNA polymerase IV [Bacteroidaceae bacterium]